MAYSRPLPPPPTCGRCGKKATMEVFNRYNARAGTFCAKCGPMMLESLRRAETKDAPRVGEDRYA
jgi:hypothetical protein